jgi:hypothetical protein
MVNKGTNHCNPNNNTLKKWFSLNIVKRFHNIVMHLLNVLPIYASTFILHGGLMYLCKCEEERMGGPWLIYQ